MTNCYILCEKDKEKCIIIDPGVATDQLINVLEQNIGTQDEYSDNLIILLTHGHFDHIGAVHKLLTKFNGATVLIDQDDLSTAKAQKSLVSMMNNKALKVYNFEEFNFSAFRTFDELKQEHQEKCDESQPIHQHLLKCDYNCKAQNIDSKIENMKEYITKETISKDVNTEVKKQKGVESLKMQNEVEKQNKIKEWLKEQNLTIIKTPGHTPGSSVLLFSNQNWLFSGDTLFSNAFGSYDFPGGSEMELKKSLKKLQNMFTEQMQRQIFIFPGHGKSETLFQALKNVQWFFQ